MVASAGRVSRLEDAFLRRWLPRIHHDARHTKLVPVEQEDVIGQNPVSSGLWLNFSKRLEDLKAAIHVHILRRESELKEEHCRS